MTENSFPKESKNAKYGVIISYIVFFVNLAGSLFVTNRVLNFIGDYNYGLYSFVSSITSWVAILSNSLIASYIRFATMEEKNRDACGKVNTIFFKSLLWLGILTLLIGGIALFTLFLLNVPIGNYSFDDSKLIYLLFGLSLFHISINLPATVFSQFVNFKREFIFEKALLLAITILQYAAHFLIAYFTRNILLLSAYSIFSTFLSFLINFIYCKKRLNINFEKTSLFKDNGLTKEIIAFSSVLILNSIVLQIDSSVDRTILGFLGRPNDVTIYQLGQMFIIYLETLTVAVSSVFIPRIHSLCASNDYEAVNRLFLKVSKIQAIIVSFVAFGFICCGKDFVYWWLGESRINVYYVASVLMLLNLMPLSVKLSVEIQRAYNKHRFRSYLYFAVAMANIVISIILINVMNPQHAIWACLIGTLVSCVACQWIAMNIYNYKKVGLQMKSHWLSLGIQVVFGIASASIVFVLSHYCYKGIPSYLFRFFIEGISYIVLYCALLLVFERRFIFGILKKKDSN